MLLSLASPAAACCARPLQRLVLRPVASGRASSPAAEQRVAEHLRRLRAPQSLARNGGGHALVLVGLLGRVGERHGEQSAHGIVADLVDELLYHSVPAGTRGVVHHHPVVGTSRSARCTSALRTVSGPLSAAGEDGLDLVGQRAPVVLAPVAVEGESTTQTDAIRGTAASVSCSGTSSASPRGGRYCFGRASRCACPGRGGHDCKDFGMATLRWPALSRISAAILAVAYTSGHDGAADTLTLIIALPRGGAKGSQADRTGRELRRSGRAHGERPRDLLRGRAGAAIRPRVRSREPVRARAESRSQVRRHRQSGGHRQKLRAGRAHLGGRNARAPLRFSRRASPGVPRTTAPSTRSWGASHPAHGQSRSPISPTRRWA